MSEIKDILSSASREMHVPLRAHALTIFERYYHELLFWNARMALVSATTPRDVAVKHFCDSLTIAPFLSSSQGRLLDIGAGAGFPGIPLKIAMDTLSITLVESSRKKSSFLKHVVRTLGVAGVTVENGRIENLTGDATMRTRFDTVTSRATFTLAALLEKGSSFLAPDGVLIAMKGKEADREIKEAAPAAEMAGLALREHHRMRLPVTGDHRTILVYSSRSSAVKR
jgi:16S rRNA (guanine527-N7)-methyltransferase